MTGPLAGLRVWLTRPAPNDERSARAWQERGAIVHRIPTLCIEVRRPDADDVARVAALQDAWIVLPSPRAARHLAAVCDDLAVPLRDWPVAAVGEATAIAARDAGFDVRRVAARATGVDLGRELADDPTVQRVLLPSSDRRRDELGDALRSAGRTVVDLVVHWTLPRVAAPDAPFDVVALYSPSALAFMDDLQAPAADALRKSTVACLGRTTADEAEARGFTDVLCPQAPGEDGLLELTARWWAARTTG